MFLKTFLLLAGGGVPVPSPIFIEPAQGGNLIGGDPAPKTHIKRGDLKGPFKGLSDRQWQREKEREQLRERQRRAREQRKPLPKPLIAAEEFTIDAGHSQPAIVLASAGISFEVYRPDPIEHSITITSTAKVRLNSNKTKVILIDQKRRNADNATVLMSVLAMMD